MQTIAIINEKGGTAKTTTAVNLAAALGEMGKRVLLVDLDGQAASSRWVGVEDDPRLADALLRGGGLEPIREVIQGVDLAPGCGKLDSVAHELRPTQGGQLRRVLGEVQDAYDYALIDSPPSLANRLIGNAMLAADEAVVPVETSILALDGLRILLTMLEDVRAGFGHEIRLRGVLACRYDARTRLSRLVLGELRRSLPGRVFTTVIRESVKLRECPAAGESILSYSPRGKSSRDYRALASELVEGAGAVEPNAPAEQADLTSEMDLDSDQQQAVVDFRKRASEALMGSRGRSAPHKNAEKEKQTVEATEPPQQEEPPQQSDQQVAEQQEQSHDEELCEDDWEPPIPVADVTTSEYPARVDVSQQADEFTSDMHSEMESADGFGESPAPRSEYDDDTSPAPSVDEDVSGDQRQADEMSGEASGFPLPSREEVDSEQCEHSTRRWRRKKHLLQLSGTAAGVAMLVGVFMLARGIIGEEAARHAEADEGRAVAVVPDNLDVADDSETEQEDAVEQDAANSPVPASVDDGSGNVASPADGTEDEPRDAFEPQDHPVEVGADDTAEADEQSAGELDAQSQVDEPQADDDSEPVEQGPKHRDPPADMKLTCVLQGPTGYQAMINGEMVREGDIFEGAEVLRITERTVAMELEGERFTLGFDEQMSSSDSETVAELVDPDEGDD